MLLLEGDDGQDGFVQRYLDYRSDDYEETGHALYGASMFNVNVQMFKACCSSIE